MEINKENQSKERQQPDNDNQQVANNAGSNTVKNPDDWTTGDEPMTGAQASYLKTLSDEAGEPFDDSLSKAGASKRINELQHVTGRGIDKNQV